MTGQGGDLLAAAAAIAWLPPADRLAAEERADSLIDTRAPALAAAGRGWAVFPCGAGHKRPAVDRWEQRACADPERVARHWPAAANVGIACGPSGLVVIDLDAHGELPPDWRLPGLRDGRDVLAQLAEWAGQPWPSTYMVATPSAGWHLYYRAPAGPPLRNTAGALGPQIDTRASGGYVVGAGSVVGGTAYEVLDGQDPEPLPAWLLRLLLPAPAGAVPARAGGHPGPARLGSLAATVRASRPGDRTGPLVWAAHRLAEMIAAGQASPDDAEVLVQAAVEAGIRGGERYARYQVTHVLGGAR